MAEKQQRTIMGDLANSAEFLEELTSIVRGPAGFLPDVLTAAVRASRPKRVATKPDGNKPVRGFKKRYTLR